jgi:beta-fructofuranosidase
MAIPYIASEWEILFKPEKYGNYVNDHTIVKANDGTWHLFGISSFGGGPTQERYFVHGKGTSLKEELKEVGKSIDKGTLAWAPCVIVEGEEYYMYYGPSPTQMAVSFDMYEWFGYSVNMINEPFMAAHRDHFVLKITEKKYLMYVVGVYEHRGAVSVFSSSDLANWTFSGFALTSGGKAPLTPAWGAMESPYVVKKGEKYYLFITYTNCSKETYNDTLVFESEDPLSFGIYNGGEGGAIPVTKLKAHAPEILQVDGEYYITTCGWRGFNTPHEGCVSIARLDWKE